MVVEVDRWRAWTRTRVGIASRVVLAAVGLALGAFLAFLAFGVFLFLTFGPDLLAIFGSTGNGSVPSPVGSALVVLGAGVLTASTSVVAAIRPTKPLVALAGIAVAASSALVLFLTAH